MTINKKTYRYLVSLFICICGLFMAVGVWYGDTNIILCFGFMLIALILNRGDIK